MKKYVRSATVLDYVEHDTLRDWMISNKNFGDVSFYTPLEGMVVKTDNDTDPEGTNGPDFSRYWQFIKSDDGAWEAYEITEYGVKIGDTFVVAE